MSEAPRRPMFFWLILASVVVFAFGVVTAGLWIPAIMMFDAPGSDTQPGVIGFALYSSSGPIAAALGLAVGWARVFMGSRSSGLKWILVLPLVWLIGLLAWFTLIATVCGDSFTCSV